jgi:hypothetical protein
MMDYDPARVELHPDVQHPENRFVEVNLEMLVKAIRDEEGLTEDEFQIKIYFEHFLQSLQRLNYFISANAIHPKELQADFYYPIGLMSGDDWEVKYNLTGTDMRPFSEAVKSFLARWGYDWVQEFMVRIRTGRK